MNRDGCRNCEYMIKTGLVNIMRCSIDQEMVDPLDKCSNYKFANGRKDE